MQEIDLDIRVHGFHITQVTDTVPWSYTIGLHEDRGRGELTVTDLELETQFALLHHVARSTLPSGAYDLAALQADGIRLVRVLPRYVDTGMFGNWARHYRADPPPGVFLQVLPPPSCTCQHHRTQITRLDRPPATGRARSGR